MNRNAATAAAAVIAVCKTAITREENTVARASATATATAIIGAVRVTKAIARPVITATSSPKTTAILRFFGFSEKGKVADGPDED